MFLTEGIRQMVGCLPDHNQFLQDRTSQHVIAFKLIETDFIAKDGYGLSSFPDIREI